MGSGVPKIRLLPGIVHPFSPLRREFGVRQPNSAWRADVVCSAERASIRLDLAGISRAHLHVVVCGKTRHITGHRPLPALGGGGALSHDRANILHGAFERRIDLPWLADADPLAVDFDNGLSRIEVRREAADSAPLASDELARGPS
jgi:HSP20 family molecular chaperone IbpA